ncbi:MULTISPECIES: polysaccharide pyruvyl transferase family protein [unclassified Adlercreutzia]|uniref:polysaccharide pyruvyl transferase family protein n=1 Tax=unclassified Adlercreutzia TaxID=2636013 RepID=UPI0021026564|nr:MULTISPECIES: polysaccharide pyruvyl transferase family protein [unclassified Adlercreutzia]
MPQDRKTTHKLFESAAVRPEQPVFSLYGIGGLYNYGCEAIVRGTTRMLREVYPNARVRYFSPRARDDVRQVADLGIEVVQLRAGRRSMLLRVLNRVARTLCIPFDSTRENYGVVLDGTDVLVSIGGDIYTIPAYLRLRRRYPYFNKLVRIGELAQERGISEMVVGASVGPFGDWMPAVNYYSNHLCDVDLICCRERRSMTYLESIGVSNNVCLLPDPAFFVEDEGAGNGWVHAEYLGVNLSPLSLREINGAVSDADILRLAMLVQCLMDQVSMPALLVPHVLSPNPGDNDSVFLRRVYNAMDDFHRGRAKVIEPTGFLDAKRQLRRCCLVVAARMHCAVNAMCEGVPTILLSYSQKAQGMCEFVYGSDRWALPLTEADEKLPGKLVELQGESTKVHEQLVARILDIRSTLKTTSGFKQLEHVLLSQKTNSARQ